MELPDWFRSQASDGWFLFCFVEAPILDQVAGGVAAIMKGVVETFFSAATDKFNVARTGVPITDTLHLRAVFDCFLQTKKP